jgi:hypothetical protein
MRHKFRLGRGARWLPALGATMALAAVAPSMASADGNGGYFSHQLDPQTTNVPYLAWNGEEVRLESCASLGGVSYQNAETAFSVNDEGRGRVSIPITPSFLVEDWSGTQQSTNQEPQIEPNSVDTFLTDDFQGGPGICVEGDAVSLFPGMARIELDVTASLQINTILGNLGLGSAQTLFKTQYLAGWMTLNDPSLNEMSSSSFGDSTDAANLLGDPSGNGMFNAGGKDGFLDVHVTGTMPMTGPWLAKFPAGSVTLPNDWVDLAHQLASDNNPVDMSPWDRWDTSGDSADSEGHSVLSGCNTVDDSSAPPETSDANYIAANTYVDPSLLDNGDNCDPVGGNGTAGGEIGPFSTAFGMSGDEAIGPYDPIDGFDTNLPDGNLSTQDAPMPAARVDVAIAQNSGAPGDTSGVGSLETGSHAADKTQSYSRDLTGNTQTGNTEPHNLYAPFYDEFIPATGRGNASSGIDGAVITGDFPNFIGTSINFDDFNGGVYHFWDALPVAQNYGGATACFNEDPYQGGLSDTDTNPKDFWQKPKGASDVAVYTDQNGEAQVKYNPGTGFFFDQLPQGSVNDGVLHNSDNGCDLQNFLGKPIGTSAITATAKYPFKPVDFNSTTSNTVTKTVISQWSKTIGAEPKGDGESQAEIVAVHAQDITGAPYTDEVVCFTATNAALTPFKGTAGGVSYADENSVPDPATATGANSERTCVTTDDNGNAAVVAIQSEALPVDVNADFVQEGIMRDVQYTGDSGATAGTLPPPPPATGGPTTGGAPTITAGTVAKGPDAGTTPPSASLAKVEGIDPALVAPKHGSKKAVIARVDSLRLVMASHARHYLLVKVISGHKTARLALTFQVRKGHKTALVHRTLIVRTNRSLKIGVAKTVIELKGAHLVG